MTETNSERVDRLREALLYSTGDEQADAFLRMTLRASIANEPDLIAVYDRETAPRQAELDLHLSGDTIHDHEARAKPLGNFLRFASQTVNEISKSISPIGRLGDRLIVEPGPGSVRLQMRVPVASSPSGQDAIEDGTPTVESLALDVLTSLFEQAEADDVTDSPLTAAVQELSPKARNKVRLFARTARDEGWIIEGRLRRRGTDVRQVRLTARGASRLIDEASREDERREEAVMFGTIDGHLRAESVISFQPEGARPFKAAVMDADLMNQVARLAADEGVRVRAVFDVFSHIPAGQTEVVHRSMTLRRIGQFEGDQPLV